MFIHVKNLCLLLLPCKNWLDLQMPIESLVEKKSSLECWYDWKPCQKSNWFEKNRTHSIIICLSKDLGEVPESGIFNNGPHRLSNLKKQKYQSERGEKKGSWDRFWGGGIKNSTKHTSIKPRQVGRNARQQTITSFKDSSHMTERVITMARTLRKRNALNILNIRW